MQGSPGCMVSIFHIKLLPECICCAQPARGPESLSTLKEVLSLYMNLMKSKVVGKKLDTTTIIICD